MSAIEALTAVLTAELPGSPGGVRALADSWRHSARAIKEAADLADAARAATTTWTGRSAEAFTTTARTLTRALDTDVDTLGTGARALDLYAETLDAATAAAENLRRRAAVALTTAHADPTAAAATATEITTAWNTLRTTITTAATRTAALLTTTNTDTDDAGDTADPQAGNGKKDKEPPATDKKTPLSNSDINRFGGLKDQADGEADWDPDANQSSLSNCYLLATLQAYSQTEEGRQYLRNHVTWDEDRQAFAVTFPDSDEPVYVSDYYTNGAKDSAAKPTIMTIYERAYGIHYGDKEFNKGGDPRDAMENITSEDTRSVNAFGFKWGFIPQQQHQYTDDEWDDIQRSVEDGKPVVASTTGGDFSDGATVQAATDTNDDGKIDTDNKTSDERWPPDQAGAHRIVGKDYDGDGKDKDSSHSYTVVAVDDDYVTLRNPWGHNDTADGYTHPADDDADGLIRITRADYEKYFNRTDIGETP